MSFLCQLAQYEAVSVEGAGETRLREGMFPPGYAVLAFYAGHGGFTSIQLLQQVWLPQILAPAVNSA